MLRYNAVIAFFIQVWGLRYQTIDTRVRIPQILRQNDNAVDFIWYNADVDCSSPLLSYTTLYMRTFSIRSHFWSINPVHFGPESVQHEYHGCGNSYELLFYSLRSINHLQSTSVREVFMRREVGDAGGSAARRDRGSRQSPQPKPGYLADETKMPHRHTVPPPSLFNTLKRMQTRTVPLWGCNSSIVYRHGTK